MSLLKLHAHQPCIFHFTVLVLEQEVENNRRTQVQGVFTVYTEHQPQVTSRQTGSELIFNQ